MVRESTTAKGVHEILYVAGTSSWSTIVEAACFKKVINNLIY